MEISMRPQPPLPQDQTGDSAPSKLSRSTLISRNVTVAGHRTSVRLEPEMWNGFTEICRRERATLHEVCTAVAQHKTPNTSLTAAIRVFVMAYFRVASTEEGHTRAGHGQGLLVGAAVAQIVHNVFVQTAPRPPVNSSSPLPPPRINPLLKDGVAAANPAMGYRTDASPFFNPPLPRR
jgi:predicted DNA-binding ribbon-helix-helix protein